jgi:hypothetical protein
MYVFLEVPAHWTSSCGLDQVRFLVVGIASTCEASVDPQLNLLLFDKLQQTSATDFSMPLAQRALQQVMIVGHESFPRQDLGSPWAGKMDANPWVIKRWMHKAGCDWNHAAR